METSTSTGVTSRSTHIRATVIHRGVGSEYKGTQRREGVLMSTANEDVVRRYFEEMCNGRKNELAPELFLREGFTRMMNLASQGPGYKPANDGCHQREQGQIFPDRLGHF